MSRLTLMALVALVWQGAPGLGQRLDQIRAAANIPAIGAVTFSSVTIDPVVVTGVRKLGDATPTTSNDLWHIGSLTKSFTSTLIGRQVERGELAWTATLGELLGAERAKKFAPVTLAQVLSHRAGLPANVPPADMMAGLGSKEALPVQRRGVIDRVLATDPLSAPGTTFLYSNVDYILAGAILEEKTGKPWEALLTEEVLAPLKLASAGFGAPGTTASVGQPRGHRAQGATLTPVEPGVFADNPPFLGPAGTLHMSIADLARWGQEHLRGERGVDGLLKAATYQAIHKPPTDGADYALGWVVQQRNGARVIWHNGSNTMWYAIVAFNPAADRGVVIVTNGATVARPAIDAAAMDLVTTAASIASAVQTLPAGAVYSADRSHMAYLANGSTPAMSSSVDIHLRRLSDGVDMKVATFDGVVNNLAFSADGQQLTFTTARADEPPRVCAVAVTGRTPVACRTLHP
jgi:D-alanyl-D-alanine carboxypeptidase